MNNLYNLTQCLRRANIDAELVLWRGFDYLLTDDPRWETENVILKEFTNKQLDLLNKSLPNSVREVPSKIAPLPQPVDTPFPRHLLEVAGYHLNNIDGYLSAMQDYDPLVVSGQAILIAPFTGKPYITFPYGADLYESPFSNDAFGKCILAGWRRANAHVLSGGNFFHYARILGLQNCTYIPILIDTDTYHPAKNITMREELLKRYDCERLFIAPARHSWSYKGNEKIIEAVAQVARLDGGKRFKVIFNNWGEDLEKSRMLVTQKGLNEICVFIGAMSKKALHEYIRASDAVLDQFCLGEYGTLTLEAMSLAKPVILYYNWNNKIPVFNAFSIEEIAQQMVYILDHPDEAAIAGRRGREWVVENHGPGAVIPRFIKVFEAVLNGEMVPQFPRLME